MKAKCVRSGLGMGVMWVLLLVGDPGGALAACDYDYVRCAGDAGAGTGNTCPCSPEECAWWRIRKSTSSGWVEKQRIQGVNVGFDWEADWLDQDEKEAKFQLERTCSPNNEQSWTVVGRYWLRTVLYVDVTVKRHPDADIPGQQQGETECEAVFRTLLAPATCVANHDNDGRCENPRYDDTQFCIDWGLGGCGALEGEYASQDYLVVSDEERQELYTNVNAMLIVVGAFTNGQCGSALHGGDKMILSTSVGSGCWSRCDFVHECGEMAGLDHDEGWPSSFMWHENNGTREELGLEDSRTIRDDAPE